MWASYALNIFAIMKNIINFKYENFRTLRNYFFLLLNEWPLRKLSIYFTSYDQQLRFRVILKVPIKKNKICSIFCYSVEIVRFQNRFRNLLYEFVTNWELIQNIYSWVFSFTVFFCPPVWQSMRTKNAFSEQRFWRRFFCGQKRLHWQKNGFIVRKLIKKYFSLDLNNNNCFTKIIISKNEKKFDYFSDK